MEHAEQLAVLATISITNDGCRFCVAPLFKRLHWLFPTVNWANTLQEATPEQLRAVGLTEDQVTVLRELTDA